MTKRNTARKTCGIGAAAVLGAGIGGCSATPPPEEPAAEPPPVTDTTTEPTTGDTTTEPTTGDTVSDEPADATPSGPLLPGGPGYASPTRYAVLHPKRIVNA